MSERIYDAWRPTDRCGVEFEDVIKPEREEAVVHSSPECTPRWASIRRDRAIR